MLMILVQWILHKTHNHISQYHLGVQLDPCIFGALPPIQHFTDDICPSVRPNELLRPSSLLHRSPLSYFWLSQGSTPKFSPIFTIPSPLLPLLLEFSKLEAQEQICEPNCYAVVNCFLFLQYGLHDDSVLSPIRSLVDSSASRIHARFVLILLDGPLPQFFRILQSIAGAIDVSQLLTRVLNGLFEFLVLRVNEINPSQFSCVFKMELLMRPLLLLLPLGILSNFLAEFWP